LLEWSEGIESDTYKFVQTRRLIRVWTAPNALIDLLKGMGRAIPFEHDNQMRNRK